MRASPLEQIMEKYGDGESRRGKDKDGAADRKAAKDALVKAVRALAKKGDLLDDDFSEEKGVERVSNRKLLRLVEVAEKVQDEFGSRSGLVEKILDLEGRAKDGGYKERLEGQKLTALYDHHGAAVKRARKAKAN